ncbi:MAG: tRNA (adenosine(37)-N6)-threonylcarbamoyltransferase complex dimerization subunit type 1 TsaB [Treponema sp.]|jgi:tRNA threonylcarbamoyladenosine biosynthesis protein TsaB|nr:tRNA (adenosine(37)-N6)-threonylcarbamoyltransferase complex dimerization subunit type 1 TsaB [Treponema sp.]
MNLLAVDTATEKFSAALAAGNDTWLFEADAGLRHSELVMDAVDMLFKKAALKPEDLSGIVCMGGPGSFTGLRIGFSLAKGLALALGCPFAAIPTLDCMARPFFSLKGLLVPVLDAKKSSFFCAVYRDGKKVCADMDAGPAAIAGEIASASADQVLLFGPGADMLYNKLTQLPESPLADIDIQPGEGLRWGNAQTLLEIARETDVFSNAVCKNAVTDFSAGPEYIRKSDAEERKESRERFGVIGERG